MSSVDHLVYAVNELQEGIHVIKNLTGITPVVGGNHPGNGTCNALLSLGNQRYLEIMAPDLSQSISGTFGEQLNRLKKPGLCKWAVKSLTLDELNSRLMNAEYQTIGPLEMNRTRPDGILLEWRLLFIGGQLFADSLPFIIDWGNSDHPAAELADGCLLENIELTSPEPKKLQQLLGLLQLDQNDDLGAVRLGKQLSLQANINTPNGLVRLPFWQPD